MSQEPPKSRRSPTVERGGQGSGDDEEAHEGTVRRSTASIVSRGGQPLSADEDPEAGQSTNARPALPSKPLAERKKPAAVSRGSREMKFDPERKNKTQASIRMPEDEGGSEDPV